MPDKRDWRKRGNRGGSAGRDEPAPPEPSSPARKGWRREEKPRGARAAGGSLGGWLTPKSRDADASRSRHYAKLLLLGLVTVALVFVFYRILVKRRDVPLIAIAVTRYHDVIHPNAYAWEDLERLREGNPNNIELACAEGSEVTTEALTLFLKNQLKAPPGGPNNDALIIYVSAHGVLDGEGKPCLLLADSDPYESSTWYPVRDLLQLIIRRVEGQAHSKPIKKLVLLDSGRMVSNWPMGVLENEFPRRLVDVVKQINDPSLYVLSSNQSGQCSWAAPELGGSVFGFFVAQGLAGQNDEDGKVTLLDLYRHVHQGVFNWAQARRASQQRPLLIHAEEQFEDFPLVYSGRQSIEAPTQDELDGVRQALEGQWAGVFDLWSRAENLRRSRNVVRLQPLDWAVLQQHLLRAERLMFAGETYKDKLQDTIGEAATLLDQLTQPVPGQRPLTLSLPPALPATGSGLSADELTRAQQAWSAHLEPKKDGNGEPGDLPAIQYGAAAAVTWNWLVEHNSVGANQLREAVAFLDQNVPNRPRPDLIVAHYVRLLSHDLDVHNGDDRLRRESVALSLRARNSAEQLADPLDERIQYFLYQSMGGLENRRRLAEDKLFVGDNTSLSQARDDFLGLLSQETGRDGYPVAAQQAQQLTRLYALRDEMDAELPYLAEWLVEQLELGKLAEDQPTIEAVAEELLPMIDAKHKLAADLERGRLDLLENEAVAGESWERLKSLYTEQSRALAEDRTFDEHGPRKIATVLVAPNLDINRRDLLMRKLMEWLCARGPESSEQAIASTPEDEKNQKESHLSQAWRDADSGTGRHPALAILDRSEMGLISDSGSTPRPADNHTLWLAAQGAEIRRRLADLSEVAARLAATTNRGPWSSTAVTTPIDIRLGLSQADRLTRNAAALRATASTSDEKPTGFAQRLRRLDLHFQLLWHSRRMLDDFWGPSPDVRGSNADFYVAAVSGYLESARALGRGVCQYDGHIREIERQLQNRRQAAETMARGLHVEDSDVQLSGQDIPHEIGIDWQTGLPNGEAAIYVTSPVARSEVVPLRDIREDITVRRRGWLYDRRQQLPMQHLIPRDEIVEENRLTAVVYYRGHRWSKDFLVPVPTGIREYLTWRDQRDSAKIEVRGQLEGTRHVMFVLDCSGSMTNRGGDRMGPAKQALRRILGVLEASQEPYAVGLRVYGNRFGFNRDLTVRKRFGDAEIATVHPDEDIQLIQPLGILDRRLLAELNDQLRVAGGVGPLPLDAWGQTPLYLTLQACFLEGDFGRVNQAQPKRIVLVTDGENDQVQRKTLVRDVLAARRKTKMDDVPIDIIGLDLKEDAQTLLRKLQALRGQAPDANSMLELVWLARQTNGNYYSANAGNLGDQLRAALGLVQYSVRRIDGQTEAKRGVNELGEPWSVEGLARGPGQFEVQLHGIVAAPMERLTLEGGEDVVLEYNRLSNQLRYPAYDPPSRRGPLHYRSIQNRNVRVRAQALLPKPVLDDDGAWDFFVSIQEQELPSEVNRFTVRSRQIWAEIQPRAGRQDVGPAYEFYDCDFLEDQPVPVFCFRVRDWPESATAGVLRFWLAMDSGEVIPSESRLVQDSDEFQVRGLTGVSFRVSAEPLAGDRYRVVVTEERLPSAGVEPLRVQLYPPPERIEHKHYFGVHRIEHRFDYPAVKPADVVITRRSRITNNAISVPEIEVILPPR